MNRVYEYLPKIEKSSSTFREVTRIVNEEFKPLYHIIRDLDKQLNIDTATWGLKIYESELKLPIEPDKSYEERRAIIKAKWKGTGKVDNLMIKVVVEAFTSSVVNVAFDGEIIIEFPNGRGIRFSSELIAAIDEIKPAHLNYRYEVHKGRIIQIGTYLQKGNNTIPLCNTIESGTWWYQQNLGRVKHSTISIDTEIKDRLFKYPETALTVPSVEKYFQYYEFATQLTVDQLIALSSILKSVQYDHIKANEIISGEYPDIMNKIKSVDKGMTLGSEVDFNLTEYPIAGEAIAKESD